ncbi:MAG: radical SAM family heme chaperone HemW [Pseudorhodobacter sp.]
MKHRSDNREGGFGIYLHWPFCQSKCPYCDFNSHVSSNIDQTAWANAYCQEVDRIQQETNGRIVNSIYFGGGTPSLMTGATVTRILDRIRLAWSLANDCEITLEANPSSVEASRFAEYRECGVNRISIGVQALDDTDLRRLGRMHSKKEALHAITVARDLFSRVNFDLIYARQDQSLAKWKEELRQALAMEPDHLSLYQLTIEKGTVFGNRFDRGLLGGLPHEDLSADLYELTQDLCEASGLPAYEISNHAKSGYESIHNRIYWTAGDYIGIGPGAHGRLTLDSHRWATESLYAPTEWLANVPMQSAEIRTKLTPEERSIEYILMGLRVSEGISLERHKSLCGKRLNRTKIEEAKRLGLLSEQGGRLHTTKSGRLLLNQVVAMLLD